MNSTTPSIPDLWPKDLQVTFDEPSPVKILRQQAFALGQRTRNFVVGKVRSEVGKDEFIHQFWVMAPFLNFEQRILLVRHSNSSQYPASLVVTDRDGQHLNSLQAPSAVEFMEQLRSELSQPRIAKLIGSLLAQSDTEDEL